MTLVSPNPRPDDVYEELRGQFSEEVVKLTVAVAAIKAGTALRLASAQFIGCASRTRPEDRQILVPAACRIPVLVSSLGHGSLIVVRPTQFSGLQSSLAEQCIVFELLC